MRIAIDLNDVLRDYSKNFAKYFKREYDHSFNCEKVSFYSNNMMSIFPFVSEAEYNKFVYEDYSFELYGRCDAVNKRLAADFLNWYEHTIRNIDTEENIDVIIVSPMEYGLTIQGSFFFLSKLGIRVREVYFPKDSSTIWDKCDMLITANPKLLNEKPDGKISIKINMEYNKDCDGDESYDDINSFMSSENNLIKYLKK